MKELNREETLEVLGACLELLANREAEISQLYDRLQTYEPDLGAEGKILGAITPDTDEENRKASGDWPVAIAICGTPLVGRSLMLMCPQVGLRIVGITDSGLDGLKLSEKHKPSFAFIDLDVNDIDGLVLISRLKEILPEITIIAISGASQESALVSSIIAGASEVIGKPLQAKRLMNIIGRLVKKGKRQKTASGTLPLHIDPSCIADDSQRWTVI